MSHGGNQERWLLTYSDLITLLMVFFIVMYSISEADKGKFLQLRSSMQQAFKSSQVGESPDLELLEGGGAAVALEIPRPSAPVVVGESKGIGNDNESSGSLNEGETGSESSSGAATGIDSDDPRLAQIRNDLLPLAASQGVSEYLLVYRSPEGLVISLSGNLLFDSGKAELKSEGVAFLQILAELVKPWSEHLRVEGHTDNIALNSSLYPSNWELSAERAVVTTRFLVEHCGLSPGRVAAAAFGEFRPVADNNTREGRLRNRRVDIMILDASLGNVNVLEGGQAP